MLTQRRRFESTSELMEKKREKKENTGKVIAISYMRLIIEKKGEERYKIANELYNYLNGRFRDEPVEFQQEFINQFDSKGENLTSNTLYDLINPKDDRNDKESYREAAILLIVVLSDTMSCLDGGKRLLRLAHYLLKVLIKMDESQMEMGARTLSFLIHTSKVYAAELVEKCLDQSFEWIQQDNSDNSRLVSSILLRELAIFTTTAFFLRAQSYFSSIFHLIRSPKIRVRIAAASSLHYSLSVTSQREAKDKRKWYYTCYQEALACLIDNGEGMNRDERYHSMLLTLNELLTIANSSIQREMIRAIQSIKGTRKDSMFGAPLEFILGQRSENTVVESRTASRLIQENIGTIWERIMETRSSKQQFVISTFIEILPRLSTWMTSSQLETSIETLIPLMNKYVEAQLSLGLLIQSNHIGAKKYICSILSFARDSLQSYKKKRSDIPSPSHSNLFILLALIVRTYGRTVNLDMKDILPLLLNYPLCRGLKNLLNEIYFHNEHLRQEVINGLLHQLSFILMGDALIGKSNPSFKLFTSIKVDSSYDCLERYELAMRTLGEFPFTISHLYPFMLCISEGYLVCDSIPLRLSSVKCCIAILRPFLHEYEIVSSEQRLPLLLFIQSILKCLVSVSLVDSDVTVRLCVIEELWQSDASLISLLSQPSLLQFLRLSLRDDNLEMREAVVSLLSKIGMLNPSLVFPRLRRVLLETIGQLTNSRDSKMEEHSARLISRLAVECPQFTRPYLGSVMQALIPKLNKDFRYIEATVHVLTTMSELSIVGGSEAIDCVGIIFPLLISFITDSTSISRQEEALRTMYHLGSSTTIVVDVYREYPQLMTILLSLIKTQMSSSMRILTMRILGTLGAIDPYTYKTFSGVVHEESNGSISGLSLPTTNKMTDSIQDTMELLNYGRCTPREFYSSITIAHLIKMIEKEELSHTNFEDITHDLVQILRTLHTHSHPFVSKVIPQLVAITKNSKKEHKEYFLRKLSSLLSLLPIGDNQSIILLDQVFSLIANICKQDLNSQNIIGVVSIITSSMQSNIGQYVCEVIPYILDAMKRDRNIDHNIISKCLLSLCEMRGCLSCHLHLVIPSILFMIEDSSIDINLRREAFDSLYKICEKEELSDYSPAILQVWTKVISLKELELPAMNLIRLIISTKWKHLNVFQRSIQSSLRSNSIDCPEYNEYLREHGEWMRYSLSCRDDTEEYDKNLNVPSSFVFNSSPRIQSINSSIQKPNWDAIRRSFDTTLLSSKEDWSEWIVKVRQSCIRYSPSHSITSIVALTDANPSLGKDLFNPAFLSVWCEMNEELQDEVTNNLIGAIECKHPHVVQTILNLWEFVDHSDMGPILISYKQLGKAAEDVECYAKALRYKELEIKMETNGDISVDNAHSLINFSNKLNLQEEAEGVIECVKQQKGEISKGMRSLWYEKLNEWEKSLQILNECREEREKEGISIEQLNEQECTCLEALGKWNELNEKIEYYGSSSEKMYVIGARGSWMSGEWERMEEYTNKVHENTLDGSFLRGVIAIKREDYIAAHSFIQKCRDIHDVQLTGLANESYDRAYPAILILQELTELEEAIEYRLRPERRGRIALLWSRRLQECRDNVEQWQRLIMLRSIVLSPSEMHPIRVRFSSICRSQNKMSQSRSQLSQLLGLSSSTQLNSISPSHDNPHLVLALAKQLWMDDEKDTAISRLESLSRSLIRWPKSVHSSETRRITAKIFLKLGQWNEYLQSQLYPSIESRNEGIGQGESSMARARLEAIHSVKTGLAHRVIREEEEKEIGKIIEYYSKTTEYDPEWHKGWHRLATAYFNVLSRIKIKGKNESERRKYAIEAIRAFTKALQLATGSRLEDTLRLLSLWFEYGEEDEVFEELRHSNKSLPLVMWLEVIPQVMGRLDSSSRSGLLIQQVVLDVAKKYPQSLVYALTVGRKSNNETRSIHASHLLSLLSKLYPNLVHEATMVSDELVRCSILWHELWHECLEEASRLYFQEKNVQGMLEILEPMHKMIDDGPTTLKEHSFYQTYLCDLEDARKFCLAFERTQNGKELTQAWELYYSIFKRITVQLKTITSLDLNYISPILQKAKELELAVPGTFDPLLPPVTIYSFSSHLQVITSKQRPRKMSMRGSDGKEYTFLLKGHEDPRQDERVMQFFGLINTLLLHNGETTRRNVTIQRYSVTALSQKSGLIGWVPDSDTLHSLVKDYREKKKMNLQLERKVMLTTSVHIDQLTVIQKIELFQMALNTSNGEDLADIIWLKSPSSEIWFDRRTNYTRSMACMSMVGHILGLGDRHPSNVMLNRESGKIVHIDFGDCFEVAQTREKYPEKIPFRLTRMLEKGMEVTGIEGNYRLTCERVMQLLRGKKDSLLAVLEAFVYDPLINWRLLDVNKRNPGEKKDMSKMDSNDVNEEVSSRVLDRIKLKLSGREFNSNQVTSTKDQVNRLIEQATSNYNLAQSYIGWCPFW